MSLLVTMVTFISVGVFNDEEVGKCFYWYIEMTTAWLSHSLSCCILVILHHIILQGFNLFHCFIITSHAHFQLSIDWLNSPACSYNNSNGQACGVIMGVCVAEQKRPPLKGEMSLRNLASTLSEFVTVNKGNSGNMP